MPELKLSQNMRKLRKVNKYSHQYVSDAIHIARQTYSLYENGKRIPDTEILCNLAELYQVSVDDMLYSDFSGNLIAESNRPGHNAILPNNSIIRLSGPEAKMLMDCRSLPIEDQKDIRQFIRFKKHLRSKEGGNL